MKITVFGTGYVGLVTGICFAEMGNDVLCVDIDQSKVQMLNSGVSPIYEPGLQELITTNLRDKRVRFTSDIDMAVQHSELIFIAVGTPSDEDGSADMQYVLKVAETIGQKMNAYKLIVNKSTVPVGTQKRVAKMVRTQLQNRNVDHAFDVASNPEFLREGQALEDCLKPSRVVIGVESAKAESLLRRLYEPFLKSGNPLLVMSPESSEMTKYAANGLLATKISFMNELSGLCEETGADIEQVRRGIGSDFRIGPHFIFAGVGYGGSCFPKDVKALIHMGKEHRQEMSLLNAVESVNLTQRQRFIKEILSGQPRKVALWGIAFKPGTDDIREAPALDLIDQCLRAGIEVVAYDPVAATNAANHFEKNPGLKFANDQYEALGGADALCIMTEWKSFREPDFDRMKESMNRPMLFDGRNLYNVVDMKERGWNYLSIGRRA